MVKKLVFSFAIPAALLGVFAANSFAQDSLNSTAAYSSVASETAVNYRHTGHGYAKLMRLEKQAARRQPNRKPNKPQIRGSFVGSWGLSLSKKANTCAVDSVPNSIRAGLYIDSKLVGTDLADKSPFFKGQVSGDTITFGRVRSDQGCNFRQVLSIKSSNGKSGSASIRSETKCGSASCYTLFSGPASK
jgi:hypothetical protein